MKNGLPSARSTMETYSASESVDGWSARTRRRTSSSASGSTGEPLDLAQAHPLRDLATERVAAVEVVGAVGHDERDARHRTGEEEAEHVAGGLVGPVGVLDHDEDRGALGDGGEEVAERVVDVAAVEGLVARRGLAAADPAAGLEAGEGGVHLEHAARPRRGGRP